MTIQVYNTLSRRKEPFEPVSAGNVGMYVCGPTVYAPSHVGHMVGPVLFDAIKRYLAYNGYQVSLVVNITDVDDKIIAQAAREATTPSELAERITTDYIENLSRLNVAVDHFPRATRHIAEIQSIIQTLIDKGHAYAAGGDVYFDVTTSKDYGKLSNRRPEELLAGARKEVSDLKRHAGDFAMWKGAKPGEPSWESPWGPGRPGWHIECSAMSMKLLGETFDIHGGGLDLCFPHHEDEIAQSECATGKPFAKYWLHNGLMQYSDATRKIGAREGDFASQESGKMSKSKGNIVTIRELLDRFGPELIRFFLLSTHYRRPIDFSDERIEEVGRGLQRLRALADRIGRVLGRSFVEIAPASRRRPLAEAEWASDFLREVAEFRRRFLDAMDDDFNTGGAIGVLFELSSAINRHIDQQGLEDAGPTADRSPLERAAGVFRELTSLLGVLLEGAAARGHDEIATVIESLLAARQAARKHKQFALSDSIRDRLQKLGIVVKDSREGSRWEGALLTGPQDAGTRGLASLAIEMADSLDAVQLSEPAQSLRQAVKPL